MILKMPAGPYTLDRLEVVKVDAQGHESLLAATSLAPIAIGPGEACEVRLGTIPDLEART